MVGWYRDRITQLLNSKARQSYDEGSDEQLSGRVNRMIEKHVRQRLTNEFVKTEIMTDVQIEPMIINSIKWL